MKIENFYDPRRNWDTLAYIVARMGSETGKSR